MFLPIFKTCVGKTRKTARAISVDEELLYCCCTAARPCRRNKLGLLSMLLSICSMNSYCSMWQFVWARLIDDEWMRSVVSSGPLSVQNIPKRQGRNAEKMIGSHSISNLTSASLRSTSTVSCERDWILLRYVSYHFLSPPVDPLGEHVVQTQGLVITGLCVEIASSKADLTGACLFPHSH